jgi:serine/threonine protein kinase
MQLFDFGLAKELKAVDLVESPDSYNATGLTGTLRIMAPEVLQSLHYGLSADVYSFGMLCWEVFSCEQVLFGWGDFDSHVSQVVGQGIRPRHLKYVPTQLDLMMNACWSANRAKRPSFESLCEQLQAEIVAANK